MIREEETWCLFATVVFQKINLFEMAHLKDTRNMQRLLLPFRLKNQFNKLII